MSTSSENFDALLQAVRQLVVSTPALQSFAPVPDELQFTTRVPARAALAEQLQNSLPPGIAATQPLLDAARSVFEFAQWRATYQAEEVGRDFIDRYGYFELYGPEGHYVSYQSRAFIAYWGSELNYPAHSHEAEEIYYVAGGQGIFGVDAESGQTVKSGQVREHRSNQSHWMKTDASAIFCLVLWRGSGLAGTATLDRSELGEA